jgi:tetratricopeptide (TPR) repeat protein
LSSARIEELRKKFDENPRRYFAPLANEYRKAGDFDQAIFICQEYLPQQPGHMSGHIVFGQALFEAKRLPEAKTVFETALSLDPENLIALRHLADISRELGDADAARGWYDRVLQADPRNEEVLGIVARLGSAGGLKAGVAPTVETPAKTSSAETRSTPDVDAAAAPTVELTAEAVQAMVKARAGTKPADEPRRGDTLPEPMTLDTTPTVEIDAGSHTGIMEGLEPTAHSGEMEIPPIEPLGLETNAAPGLHDPVEAVPALLDGLDVISLEVSLPSAPPSPPETVEIPAASTSSDDGLLDLGSFSIGGDSQASSAPPPTPSPADVPIDGGHEGTDLIDLDFDAPAAPSPESPQTDASVPTMIIDAVKGVVPAVQDAVESAAPALMDFVDTAIPAVVNTVKTAVETVVETPTVIMEAIKAPGSAETPDSAAAPERPSQSIPFVTETMAQLYLSQGHRSEAIDIYRKLIDARPNDRELKARLEAIQNAPPPLPAVPASAQPDAPHAGAITAAPRFAGSGPTIRTLLRELFGLETATSYGGWVSGGSAASSVPSEVGSIDMLFSAQPVGGGLNPLAVAFDGGYVAGQGSIDDLFSGAR